MKRKTIRIGTRGSALALAQTRLVEEALKEREPSLSIETVVIRTQGDQIREKPLSEFGGRGVFIAEIEDALRRGDIDLAVHSAKDLPVKLGENLVIAGVLPREDASDVLVTKSGLDIAKMECPRIGTGSPRRQFQIKEIYPRALLRDIRGNVETRLQKLSDGALDGVVLAAAGLMRLGIKQEARYSYRCFAPDEMLPAGGQGILAIEGRDGDASLALAARISDERTFLEFLAERAVLEAFDAGCHAAIGVLAQTRENTMRIRVCAKGEGGVRRTDGTLVMEGEDCERQVQLFAAGLAMSLRGKAGCD